MQHSSIIWPNPWYSDKDRVWIHSETCTWHDKNIQSNATQLNHLASFTKLFSVHLRTKWLWIWVSLQSLKLQILCLFRARSSLTFRQIYSVDSLWNAYVTWQEHTASWIFLEKLESQWPVPVNEMCLWLVSFELSGESQTYFWSNLTYAPQSSCLNLLRIKPSKVSKKSCLFLFTESRDPT